MESSKFLNILLIEPSHSLSLVISGIGFSDQINITRMTEGKQALDHLSNNKVDLVVTAYELADTNGADLCTAIKSKYGHGFPIILLTSSAERLGTEFREETNFTEIYPTNDIRGLSRFIERLADEKAMSGKNRGSVLLAEDSSAQAYIYRTILEDAGLAVTVVTNTETAIEILAHNDYDLMIVDIVLSGQKSGFALIEHAKQGDSQFKDLPVIVISGSDDPDRVQEAFRVGADDFLKKPVLEELFLVHVLNHIKSKKRLDKIMAHEKYLEEIATRDQLTNLHNRHFLVEVADQRISESYRKDYPLCILMIDVDRFKQINDQYGHTVGDHVLTGLANILSSFCRTGDVCARVGGEEFVMLLPYCSLSDGLQKAEAIREKIESQSLFTPSVTVSVGVSSTESLGHEADYTFQTLFSIADTAVYQAKNGGRNCVKSSNKIPID